MTVNVIYEAHKIPEGGFYIEEQVLVELEFHGKFPVYQDRQQGKFITESIFEQVDEDGR